jgi:uncharacterized protein YecT (DUF1311 family)
MIRYIGIAALCPLLLGVQPGALAAQDCSHATTQTDLSLCAGAQYEAADAELAKVYLDLMAKVSDTGKISLRDAEQAWAAYRDKVCAFETAGTTGGSIHSMVLSQCLAKKTKARIAELKTQLNCEEGDLTCGHQ